MLKNAHLSDGHFFALKSANNCKKIFDTISAPLKHNLLLFNIYYNLAKVGVASSSLVSRSKIQKPLNSKELGGFFIGYWLALTTQNSQNSH
ncbi:TPA: hypothetical protein JI046_15935 [Acinetobacter baumannii]|nr:hypothetical protein [Acinetobacter baumannii]